MAIPIYLSEIVPGENFQVLYDFVMDQACSDCLRNNGFEIAEMTSCYGNKAYMVKDEHGTLCEVIVRLKLNGEYAMFLVDRSEDADNAVGSMQTLLMYLHDSKCIKSYELELCVFTRSYLIENSLDCEPIYDVIFNRKDKNDDDIFVTPPELKYIDEDGSKTTVLENFKNKIS